MSRITEMADQEADEAEAEDEEEQEPEPQEPEPQQPPEGPSDKQLKSFEAENQRHAKRLREIMGADFAMFVECEDCAGVGFRPPAPPVLLRQHPETNQCPDCEGLGQLVSGSRVPDHYAIQCETCRGNGYVHKRNVAPAATTGTPNGVVTFTPPPPAEDPRVTALRQEGFTVVPPYVPPAPS